MMSRRRPRHSLSATNLSSPARLVARKRFCLSAFSMSWLLAVQAVRGAAKHGPVETLIQRGPRLTHMLFGVTFATLVGAACQPFDQCGFTQKAEGRARHRLVIAPRHQECRLIVRRDGRNSSSIGRHDWQSRSEALEDRARHAIEVWTRKVDVG